MFHTVGSQNKQKFQEKEQAQRKWGCHPSAFACPLSDRSDVQRFFHEHAQKHGLFSKYLGCSKSVGPWVWSVQGWSRIMFVLVFCFLLLLSQLSDAAPDFPAVRNIHLTWIWLLVCVCSFIFLRAGNSSNIQQRPQALGVFRAATHFRRWCVARD